MRNKETYDSIKQAFNKIGTEMADNYWKYPYAGVRIVFTPLLKKGESIMPNMNTLHVSEEDVFKFYFFHGVTEKSIQAAGNYARQKIHAYIDKLCQDALIKSDTHYFSEWQRSISNDWPRICEEQGKEDAKLLQELFDSERRMDIKDWYMHQIKFPFASPGSIHVIVNSSGI